MTATIRTTRPHATRSLLGLAALLAALLAPLWAPGLTLAKDSPADSQPPKPDGVKIRPPEPAPQRIIVGPEPDRMSVDIWTDRNVYYDGSRIRINFRATRDAYVYIFDTDTNGVTRQIFPNYYDTDNFVRGGSAYSIPDRNYSLTVTGPEGRETLEIVAVSERPQWMVRDYEDFSSRRPFPEQKAGAAGLMRSLDNEARQRSRDTSDDDDDAPRAGRPARPLDDEPSTHRIPPQDAAKSDRAIAPRDVRPGPAGRVGRVIITPPQRPVVVARDETTFRVAGLRHEEIENGTVSVTSYPSHARIYLDGRYQGATPKTLTLRPGSYELRVEAAGFATENQYINVRSERETRVHFYLRPERERVQYFD